jgi:tetratricopeptide (TPR) repeat protein
VWDLVPGEIVTLRPSKEWRSARRAYVAGDVAETRLDVAALDLIPLRLDEHGMWEPADEYRGEEGEPVEEWARQIVARGPRPLFELEQVLPGEDPDDPFTDPILESNDLKEAGDVAGARKILMDLCQSDLRCLDAHAHLGNLVFEHDPQTAARHYEVGIRIGELSLGKDFDGVLAWGLIHNRPFLRCMHGYGLCLWRLRRVDEAERLFERMLWLNPNDNQGIRLLLPQVKAGEIWEP